jgi:hypothetical protein
MWQNGRTISALWASNDDHNAWFYAVGLGWRKLSSATGLVFLQQLGVVTAAYMNGHRVNFFEVGIAGNIEIQQIYAF